MEVLLKMMVGPFLSVSGFFHMGQSNASALVTVSFVHRDEESTYGPFSLSHLAFTLRPGSCCIYFPPPDMGT